MAITHRSELGVKRKLTSLKELFLRRSYLEDTEASSVPYQELVTCSLRCFHNHQLGSRSSRGSTMSVVGCFGDCGFGSTPDPAKTLGKGPREYKLVFHPPIQTILREKDDSKWYTDMVNELATMGDDPNHLNEFGEAPLCVAAFKGSGMIVEEMLKQANLRVNIKGKHGRTALYLAAEGGHIFIVKLLLQHPDIDVNSRNGPGGATALMGASRRGHSRIVELLLQHPRCEADTSDKDGNTAVHHARTPSVKWRLHNHAHRSRSMETVLVTDSRRAPLANLCRVSPLGDASAGSLDTPEDPGSPGVLGGLPLGGFARGGLGAEGLGVGGHRHVEDPAAGRRLSLEARRLGERSSSDSSGPSPRLSSGSQAELLGDEARWELSGSLPNTLTLASRPRVHSTPSD